VRLESPAPLLLESAVRALSAWAGEPLPAGEPRIRLQLLAGTTAPAPATPLLAVHGSRLELRIPGATGLAEATAGTASCHVTPELAADPDRLAEEVLEPLLLFLLTRAGRIPLHAAGFLLGHRAVLLAGPSGAGKSSLALEAARAGLPVLGDDTVFLELDSGLRIHGAPRPLHVPVAGASPPGELRLRGGRWKQRAGWSSGATADQGVLCLLARGDAPGLAPLPAEQAVAELMAGLEPGFDHFREVLPDVLRRLAAGGCWRLTLDADPARSFAVLLAGFAP
jgi:hypothetical protein